MVTSAALLIRESGVGGTSFAKVLVHSKSPRGSIGHHFPGGKSEMVKDAISWAGDKATEMMRNEVGSGASTQDVFVLVAGLYRDALINSDYAAGCPIGVAAQESHQEEEIRKAIQRVFDDWRNILQTQLIKEGRSANESRDLAQLAVASVEGALLIARIDQDSGPVDSIIRQITPLLSANSSTPAGR
ncbi:MAG TPA: TetR family transcriptional regulator C-terminal domain-containing protein [Solirubrobacterales bacterium]|nr:TetR family transcriptional regulator C-terminal domain-containing protein [Solirubrobacterales bacterium]